ncbi:hypothetical protein Ancab_026679 [Ancistrocladus abbreviatus]
MKSLVVLLICLQLLLVALCTSASASSPRLIGVRSRLRSGNVSAIRKTLSYYDFRTHYYNQTLDHFNYRPNSYATFKQKYFVNYKYWGGARANAPIFVYFDGEGPLSKRSVYGWLTDNAQRFKALLVYIEHRYYGDSVPFGSFEEALRDPNLRGYFNSEQALADYGKVILHLKEKLKARHSPVIVVGGSYAGMLAAWFRLKYPHIAHGALASSAPLLYFDNITLTPPEGYYGVVSKDFRETSKSCYETIRQSWAMIYKVASRPNGLSFLSRKFHTCQKLQDASDLTNYLDDMYCFAAQYNTPPSSTICNAIDGGAYGTDILSRIYAAVAAYNQGASCNSVGGTSAFPAETTEGWAWQTCSEMVMPISYGTSKDSMYPPQPFNLDNYIRYCKQEFGVAPRPHWVTTYYGGHDIRLVLKRFGSNIIFSNGLKDPYSSAG